MFIYIQIEMMHIFIILKQYVVIISMKEITCYSEETGRKLCSSGKLSDTG